MADEKTEELAEGVAQAKPGLLDNKFLLVGIIMVLQAGMAFAATKFLIQPATQAQTEQAGGAGSEEEAGERPRGTLVSLDEMVVSLSAAGRPRFLRTTIALEAEDAAVAAVLTERMAEFRDAAIMRLSSHDPDAVKSFEGKEAVKAEIKQALEDLLEEGNILNVYFSDFVVQ